MKNLDIIKYKKGTSIYVYGKMPNGIFYQILNGNISVANYLVESANYVLGKGEFFGMVSALADEVYYSTVTAITDVELLVIEVASLEDLYKDQICDKIISSLAFSLNTWTKEYLNAISIYTTGKKYERDSMINIARYYDHNNYLNIAAYMYNKYLEYNTADSLEAKSVKERIKNIPIIEHNGDVKSLGEEKYKKDECIFCEYEKDNNIYLIKSGKVALCNVVGGEVLMQIIFFKDQLCGYRSAFMKETQTSTAVVIEDSILQKIEKPRFEYMIKNDKKFKSYMTNTMAKRVWILMMKIESMNIKSNIGKLYNLLYIIAKSIAKFNKNNYSVNIPYSIDEIMNMVGIFHDKEAILKFLSDSKYIRIRDKDIIVNEIDLFKNELLAYKRLV